MKANMMEKVAGGGGRDAEHPNELGPPLDERSFRSTGPLLEAERTRFSDALSPASVVIGELVGFANDGRTPLVTFGGQPGGAALTARSTLDLRAAHIGSNVVLVLAGGDRVRPIVLGIVCHHDPNHLSPRPGSVEVDVDGQRMIVSAKDELILRCGKARITLTKSGRVLIEGTHVISRSSGANKVKGARVEIN